MARHTGENEQALRGILDMTKLIGIVVLVTHFYRYCYATFHLWGLSSAFSDQLMGNIHNTGLIENVHKSKLIALGFLLISLRGAKGEGMKNVSNGYIFPVNIPFIDRSINSTATIIRTVNW